MGPCQQMPAASLWGLPHRSGSPYVTQEEND